jgi:Antibiotic biosynthesis monooxygenase
VIFIVVKHPVRPEHADNWLALVEEFTMATRAEPGNICFDWYRAADDPNLWLLVEAFHNGEAGRARRVGAFPGRNRQVAAVAHGCPRDCPCRGARRGLGTHGRDADRAVETDLEVME